MRPSFTNTASCGLADREPGSGLDFAVFHWKSPGQHRVAGLGPVNNIDKLLGEEAHNQSELPEYTPLVRCHATAPRAGSPRGKSGSEKDGTALGNSCLSSRVTSRAAETYDYRLIWWVGVGVPLTILVGFQLLDFPNQWISCRIRFVPRMLTNPDDTDHTTILVGEKHGRFSTVFRGLEDRLPIEMVNRSAASPVMVQHIVRGISERLGDLAFSPSTPATHGVQIRDDFGFGSSRHYFHRFQVPKLPPLLPPHPGGIRSTRLAGFALLG